MQATDEILECMKRGKSDKKYSGVIRQFCMALDFCRPAAYKYLRKVFHNHLPSPVTIRRWYRSVNGEPGITTESLQILSEKAAEHKENGRELLLALISDEVAIKKCIEWKSDQSNFSGFVSCENTNTNKTRKKKTRSDGGIDVANDALVFMVVGDDFKIPVAYYLLCGLDALDRAALSQDVIRQINETGARVTSFTADGLISNITMFKHLGVNFEIGETFFKSPTNSNDKIYVFLDPPHMLKLSRGCFAKHNLYHEGNRISWNFVTELHKMQTNRNFNLGNKLTNDHINYHTRPMNVRIANETMSNSVANCIDQLREDGYENFQESDETSKFIRHVNNVMDIGNVKQNLAAYSGYKRPICESTAHELFDYFKEAKQYFKSLEIDVISQTKNGTKTTRKSVLKTKSSTPFFGMIINLTSLEGLYNDLVLGGLISALYFFKMSQDHLETWFSCLRSGLGSNDNPSAKEFTRL